MLAVTARMHGKRGADRAARNSGLRINAEDVSRVTKIPPRPKSREGGYKKPNRIGSADVDACTAALTHATPGRERRRESLSSSTARVSSFSAAAREPSRCRHWLSSLRESSAC